MRTDILKKKRKKAEYFPVKKIKLGGFKLLLTSTTTYKQVNADVGRWRIIQRWQQTSLNLSDKSF